MVSREMVPISETGRRQRAGQPRTCEIAGVVHEPGVLRLDVGRTGAHRRQPLGQPGAAAGGVDDQVGRQLVARGGSHADHVGHARRHVGPAPGEQPGAGHAPPHVDPVLRFGRLGQHRLDDRPPPGDEPEPLVAVVRGLVERRRGHGDGVDPDAPGLDQAVDQARQLLVEDEPGPGEEVVGLVELGHARPGPPVPRVGGGARRRRRGVPFQHGDAVPVAGQHHRRRQPDHAPPAHHDRRHADHAMGQLPYSGGSFC